MRRSETNLTIQAPVAPPKPVSHGAGELDPPRRELDPPRRELDPPRGEGPLDEGPRRVGRYRILFELARGGMGRVYVACLRGPGGFNHVLALKQPMQAGGVEDAGAVFMEARLAAQTAHPNVVQVFDVGEHEGAPFIAMELVQGVSLAQLLQELRRRGGLLDPALAAWIIAQAATGLHAAHELTAVDGSNLNLVHRDVSPQNILISFEGRVRIGDFGVAKSLGADVATKAGVIKGKLAYMSPEQACARPLDRRSDIFSLGILLHETLTGQRLFGGGQPAEIVRRVVEQRAADPRRVRPEIPQPLAAIALRCLEKDPRARDATAGAVAEALRGYLREHRAAVDEGDIVAVLGELFAEERSRLRERIRAGLQRIEGEERAAPTLRSAAEESVAPDEGDPRGREGSVGLGEPGAALQDDEATGTTEVLGARPATRRDARPRWVVPMLAGGLGALLVLAGAAGGSLMSRRSPEAPATPAAAAAAPEVVEVPEAEIALPAGAALSADAALPAVPVPEAAKARSGGEESAPAASGSTSASRAPAPRRPSVARPPSRSRMPFRSLDP